MRMTVALDDELVKSAQEYTGIQERSALIRLALMELVQWRLLAASRPSAAPWQKLKTSPAGQWNERPVYRNCVLEDVAGEVLILHY